MLIISNSEEYSWPCEVYQPSQSGDGTKERKVIDVRFNRLCPTELASKLQDNEEAVLEQFREEISHSISTWPLVDEDKNPIPTDPDTVYELLKRLWLLRGIMTGWVDASSGGRESQNLRRSSNRSRATRKKK